MCRNTLLECSPWGPSKTDHLQRLAKMLHCCLTVLLIVTKNPAPPPLTCTMLGCAMVLLMAASMIAMRSRFSAPDMRAGRIIVLTATVLPRHKPAQQQPPWGRTFNP
jgi:hypothetical protein